MMVALVCTGVSGNQRGEQRRADVVTPDAPAEYAQILDQRPLLVAFSVKTSLP